MTVFGQQDGIARIGQRDLQNVADILLVVHQQNGLIFYRFTGHGDHFVF